MGSAFGQPCSQVDNDPRDVICTRQSFTDFLPVFDKERPGFRQIEAMVKTLANGHYGTAKRSNDFPAAVSNDQARSLMKHWFKIFRLGIAVLLLSRAASLTAGLADGLLAYYPLDGDGQDASGNGHDGMVSGIAATENRFGQPGKALLFDGTNSFIRIPDSTDLRMATTDFSIAAWVFETERDANYNDCIISKRGKGPPGQHGWFFSVRGLRDASSTGRLFFQVSGGEEPHAFSSGTLSLNQWHHVVVVYHHDAAAVEMFIDGAWDSRTGDLPAPGPLISVPMHIGNDSQLAYNNAYVFHGKISDVRLYSRALSSPEVAGLCDAGFFLDKFQFTGRALTSMYGGLTAGQTVVVESSPDLFHWVPIATNVVAGTTLSITNWVHPDERAGFVRISVR